jgi:hypothetical protein
MKTYKGMILFFILTVVSGVVTYVLQSTTLYRSYAVTLLIALISLFLSFTLSIVTLVKHNSRHRGLTLFVFVCSSIGVIFAIVVLVFIIFFLK